jgi:hypothetical protein
MDAQHNINVAINSQFSAALKMLQQAIEFLPENIWDANVQFTSIAFHCLFWTDYYLTENPETFNTPAPINASFNDTAINTKQPYTKAELLNYCNYIINKADKLITSLNAEKLNQRWINDY